MEAFNFCPFVQRKGGELFFVFLALQLLHYHVILGMYPQAAGGVLFKLGAELGTDTDRQ